VKNPDYPDVQYVESLIGPHTVNTMLEETIAAFADHGVATENSVEADGNLLFAVAMVDVSPYL
jgi:transaldolase